MSSFCRALACGARGAMLAGALWLLCAPLSAGERFDQLAEDLQRTLLPGAPDSLSIQEVAGLMLAAQPVAAESTLSHSLFSLSGPAQSELARLLAGEARQLRTFLVLIQLRLQAQGQSAFQLSSALRLMARRLKDSADWTRQVVEGLPFALEGDAELAASLVAAAGGSTATALFDALLGSEGPLRDAVIEHIPGVCLGDSQLEGLLALVQSPRLDHARRTAAYQAIERRGALAAGTLAQVDTNALERRSATVPAMALQPEPASGPPAPLVFDASTPAAPQTPSSRAVPEPPPGAWLEAGLCLVCALVALWAASTRRLLVSVGCLAGTLGFACAASMRLLEAVSAEELPWLSGLLLPAGLLTGLLAGRQALRIRPADEPSVPASAAVAPEPAPLPRPETRRLRAVPGGLFGLRAEPARRAMTARLLRPAPQPLARRMWFQAFDAAGAATTEQVCEGVAQEIGREAISFLCRLQLEDQALLKLVIELEPGEHLMAEAELRHCRPTSPGMFQALARVLELDPASQARLEAHEQTRKLEPVEAPESAELLAAAWRGVEEDVRTAVLPRLEIAEEGTVTVALPASGEAQAPASEPEPSAEPTPVDEGTASVPQLTDSVLLEWEEFLQSVDFEEQTTSAPPR